MSDFGGVSAEELVSQLRQIEMGLRQNLKNLHSQLSVIESKPELRNRLAVLKKDMETQADVLEADVKRLREDIKSIKELLGLNLKQQNTRIS